MTPTGKTRAIQGILRVPADGKLGPLTLEAWRAVGNGSPQARSVQAILGVVPDGIVGPVTEAAWKAFELEALEIRGLASSFADPADVAGFRRCKQRGLSDAYCFGEGDNGIGKWGADTTDESRAYCALPREDWQHLRRPQGTKVLVTVGDRTVECELQDTMPARKNIKNGCVIDLSPGAWKMLGFNPPQRRMAAWRFA